MTTEEFIHLNRDKNVRELAFLSQKYPDIDIPFALNQIAGRQTALHKLPTWVAVNGIIYPPHLSMEQCSSEFTARYKAAVARRISADKSLFVDLTGGMGVDFSFMARSFDRAIYVEQQQNLCDNARNNFPLLGLNNTEVVCADGGEYLHTLTYASVIFLDPARRDANGAKTIAISDCSPNVISLLDELLSKADYVILKLSPMLDWHKAMSDLRNVAELHILSTANECKELLFVLAKKTPISSRIYCVNDDEMFDYEYAIKSRKNIQKTPISSINYLYEPNSSIMKAGCFDLLCEKYGVEPISNNSHLFISIDEMGHFPGRRFKIKSISTLNKRELKQHLKDVTSANITTRNFPLSVAELRKKIKLNEGGDIYIFATTTAEGKHILIICEKIKSNT